VLLLIVVVVVVVVVRWLVVTVGYAFDILHFTRCPRWLRLHVGLVGWLRYHGYVLVLFAVVTLVGWLGYATLFTLFVTCALPYVVVVVRCLPHVDVYAFTHTRVPRCTVAFALPAWFGCFGYGTTLRTRLPPFALLRVYTLRCTYVYVVRCVVTLLPHARYARCCYGLVWLRFAPLPHALLPLPLLFCCTLLTLLRYRVVGCTIR